jgi:hypothetical protein
MGGTPSKPQLRDGARPRRQGPVCEFDTGEVRAAFSRAVVAAVLELHARAFEELEATGA